MWHGSNQAYCEGGTTKDENELAPDGCEGEDIDDHWRSTTAFLTDIRPGRIPVSATKMIVRQYKPLATATLNVTDTLRYEL